MTIYRGSIVPGTGTTVRGNASDIDIEDAGNIIDATNVEDALQELHGDLDTHMADTITHGTTGDIVGTSDTQTLTNKTLVAANNTITTAASGNLTATELNAALAELDEQDTAIQTQLNYLSVATVSAMTALSVSAGETVVTQGYYTAGDGGQASYLIVAPQAADGYGDHTLANGNVALLQHAGEVNIKQFGAKGDGVTDDSAAIQAGNNYLNDLGGGWLIFPVGTILMKGILQDDMVRFKGQGVGATEIKVPNSANTFCIQSRNFAALSTTTGGVTNKWLTADGVGYRLGIYDLTINGNAANNTSGNAVNYYAKGYTIDNVLIRDVAGKGFYTECGDVGGQNDWTDMPECTIGKLWIRSTGSVGFHYRGPHDGRIDWLVVANAGAECILVESSSGVYSGDPDIGYVHSYGSGAGFASFKTTSPIRAEHLVCESAGTNAFLSTSNAFEVIIGTLKAFKADVDGGGNPVVKIASANNVIGEVFIKDNNGGGGLLVDGAKTTIASLYIDGQSNGATTGLEINNNDIKITGVVTDYSGATGLGLKTTNGDRLDLNLSVINCATGWNNADASSQHNNINVNFSLPSGTALAGNTKTDRTSYWFLSGSDSSGSVLSHNDVLSAGIAIDAVTTVNTSVAHGLAATPDKNKVHLTITDVNNSAAFSLGWWGVTSVDATNVNISTRIDVGTATGGDTLKMNVHAEI